MSPSSFVHDLANENKIKDFLKRTGGDKKIFNHILQEDGVTVTWIEGNHKEYDNVIETISGKSYTSEWKTDFRCIQTGNCFVEFWCRGKDSGILATKSDYWVQVVLSNIHKGNVRFGAWETKDFIDLVNKHQFRIVGGGDRWKGGSAAKGYLVKEDNLFNKEYLQYHMMMHTSKFLRATGIKL